MSFEDRCAVTHALDSFFAALLLALAEPRHKVPAGVGQGGGTVGSGSSAAEAACDGFSCRLHTPGDGMHKKPAR